MKHLILPYFKKFAVLTVSRGLLVLCKALSAADSGYYLRLKLFRELLETLIDHEEHATTFSARPEVGCHAEHLRHRHLGLDHDLTAFLGHVQELAALVADQF